MQSGISLGRAGHVYAFVADACRLRLGSLGPRVARVQLGNTFYWVDGECPSMRSASGQDRVDDGDVDGDEDVETTIKYPSRKGDVVHLQVVPGSSNIPDPGQQRHATLLYRTTSYPVGQQQFAIHADSYSYVTTTTTTTRQINSVSFIVQSDITSLHLSSYSHSPRPIQLPCSISRSPHLIHHGLLSPCTSSLSPALHTYSDSLSSSCPLSQGGRTKTPGGDSPPTTYQCVT